MPVELNDILTTKVLGTSAFAVGFAAFLMSCVIIAMLWRRARNADPYRQTFDTASVGLVHVDMEGRWIRINEMMAAITGYPVAELTGKTLADITYDQDIGKNESLAQQLRAGEIDDYSLQKRYRHKDGRIVWVKISVTLVRDSSGQPDYYVSVVEDIDELKRSEYALREQEARYRAFWVNSPFNQTIKDEFGRLIDVNPRYRETYDLKVENIRGRTLLEAHGPGWGSDVDEFDREILQTGRTQTIDITVPGSTESDFLTIRMTKFPVYDANDQVVGVGGISYDITSQVRSAREIRESEERFRATFEQAAVGIAHMSVDGQWLRINKRYCDIVGYAESELRKVTFREITHEEDLGADLAHREALVAGRIDSYTLEKRYLHKEGYPVWVEVTASLTRKMGTTEPYVIVVVEDITDRKNAEAALAARLDQQSAVMAIGQLALVEQNIDNLLNKSADIVADTLDVDVCMISKLVAEPSEMEVVAASREGKRFIGQKVTPHISGSDETLDLSTQTSMIFDHDLENAPRLTSAIMEEIGTISGAGVVMSQGDKVYGTLAAHCSRTRHFTGDDVTFLQSVANVLHTAIVRSRIAAELADRQRTLNAVLDNAADGIVVANQTGAIIMANDAAEDIFGYDLAELQQMGLRDLVPATYVSSGSASAHESGPQLSAREMVGLRKDGSTLPIDIAMSEIDGPDGALHVALVRDITEQKSLQSQLVQASKLATVGEMAAGIAHELNQPLNIMRMAADNVLIRMESGSADLDYARDNLTLISEQAGRMGKIILHMRVFSRQDTSDFVVFNPARAVKNACELMRRQLELENVELNVEPDELEVQVLGSESQLEQVVINMITNARDAILHSSPSVSSKSSRGIIDVTMERQEDENAFKLRIHDTGGGMPESIMGKVFDPFFTTKEVGVGTGLGLSVSYGIISSMNGTINARNVDAGCEMSVELPLAVESAETREHVMQSAREPQ